MIYIKLFENHSEYEDFTGSTEYVEPHVSLCEDENDVHYNLKEPVIATDIRITETSVILKDGDTHQLNVVFTPSDVADKSLDWYSSDDSVVTVADGLISVIDNVDGDYTISAVTKDGSDLTATCVVSVVDYVEIAGIKWATKNIGANSVGDVGLYFQWGDTQGYTASQVGSGEGQKYFGWADYKYGNGASSPSATDMTKYNADDGLTTLLPEDDAALVNSGGKWRTPTNEEVNSLESAVNAEWTTNYEGSGVAGLVLTDKNDSSKVLFFPKCNYAYIGSNPSTAPVSAVVFNTTSLNTNDTLKAYYFAYTIDTGIVPQFNDKRAFGVTVRGVLND